MSKIKILSNGIWVSALGTPQAIVVSKNLKQWYPLYIEDFKEEFNHHMSVRKYKNAIVCCTGKSLLFLSKNEIENKLRGNPIITPYRGFIDKIKGTFFTLKRLR